MSEHNERQPLLSNNGFRHSQSNIVENDSTSQHWDWPPIVFVLYRLAAASYAFTVLMTGIIYYDQRKHKHFPWPVWLTNWSFFLLTSHMVLAAAITVLFSCNRGRCFQRWSLRSSVYSFLPDTELDATSSAIPPSPMPWYIKVDWLLYNVSTVAAIIVTVVFFSALYPMLNPDGGLYWGDATMHISNSILVLLDLVLCAIPIRLIHGFYCFIYGTIYILFSVIYWATDSKNVLYPYVLDWNRPLPTAGVVVFLAFVVIPLLQLLFFGLYRFRITIYKCIYGSTSSY